MLVKLVAGATGVRAKAVFALQAWTASCLDDPNQHAEEDPCLMCAEDHRS
jgi:hypothetical protein